MKPRVIGWKEWVALPELGISAVIAKSDSGAKTSVLHAFDLQIHETDAGPALRFGFHPERKSTRREIFCSAPVLGRRLVCNSGGQSEERWVIRTLLQIGDASWPIDLTLTNRENLAYRMLLGREAMRHRLMIDPSRRFLLGKPTVQA